MPVGPVSPNRNQAQPLFGLWIYKIGHLNEVIESPKHGLTQAKVKSNFHENAHLESLDAGDLINRAEVFLYTLADSSASSSVIGAAADTTAQKNGGWFRGFVSNAMVLILKV